jgi:hypothetical protein
MSCTAQGNKERKKKTKTKNKTISYTTTIWNLGATRRNPLHLKGNPAGNCGRSKQVIAV